MPRARKFVLMTLVALTLARFGVALADEPAAPPAPLGGPKIETKAEKPTLVQRDFSGKLVKLEVAPAQAAVALMTLDADTRARLDAIVAERGKLLDQLVRDNLRTLVEAVTARQSGDSDEAARLFRQLAGKARPIRDRGTLGEEFADVLSHAQAAEMKALTQEYFRAVVNEADADDAPAAMKEGEDAPRGRAGGLGRMRRVVQAETVRIAGRELARAYDRVVGTQARRLEEFLKAVSATPEQEGRIRQLTGDLFQKTYGKPEPAQQAEVFRQVYRVLTPEQRQAALEFVRGSRGG